MSARSPYCGIESDMACEIVSSDGGVFVLWGKPTKEDLDRVLERVQQTAAAAGHQIVFVARVPERAPAPDDEVRAYSNQALCGDLQVSRLCCVLPPSLQSREGSGVLKGSF